MYSNKKNLVFIIELTIPTQDNIIKRNSNEETKYVELGSNEHLVSSVILKLFVFPSFRDKFCEIHH